MNTLNTVFQINTITYDNQDDDVVIYGTEKRDHLSYNTKLIINFSELNTILNYLQQKNDAISVGNQFVEERFSGGYTQFVLLGNTLEHTTIVLPIHKMGGVLRQIWA